MTDEPNNMTVRQEYKKAALQGLLAHHGVSFSQGDLVAYSSEFADAMLAEDAAHDAKVKP